MKITFTYYGTSVNHLSAALLLDGIKEKSFDKTLHNVDSNQDFWNKLPSLSNLCSHYSKESIGGRLQLISEADPRDDKLFVDILGRERQIFKRFVVEFFVQSWTLRTAWCIIINLFLTPQIFAGYRSLVI